VSEIGPRYEFEISITEKAGEELRRRIAEANLPETAAVRVAVRPGGCSGFMYALGFEAEPIEDDIICESRDIRFFVDPFSAQYLNGLAIDYQSGLEGSGFTFDNPNAIGGCGCGNSFDV